MSSNSFGQKLKAMRTAAGLTQGELAEKAGMSKAGIADLEQGRNSPSWVSVQMLAKALGMDCNAFAADEEGDEGETTSARIGRPKKEVAEEKPAEKKPRAKSKKGESGGGS
jgi:transcriptional regulator with XRE-family HTH domain